MHDISIHVRVCRVSFQFKSSKRSNNGTDVGSGQIPELLYRLPELESEEGEELQLLGREFSSTVSPVSRKNTPNLPEALLNNPKKKDVRASACTLTRYLSMIAVSCFLESLLLSDTLMTTCYPLELDVRCWGDWFSFGVLAHY